MRASSLLTMTLCLLFFATACSSLPKPTSAPLAPERVPAIEPTLGPGTVSEGSLYVESSSSELVGDFRARHVGDVLTVLISENSLGSTSADNAIERDSSVSVEAPVIFGWENSVKGGLGPDFDPSLALSAGTSREFEGRGETSRQNRLAGTLAVRVAAVGAGGRMVVVGTKEIVVNHERQTMTLAGIVRPEDVNAGNTISSSKIAELTVAYGGRGAINDVTRQGWFHRLLDKLWPF